MPLKWIREAAYIGIDIAKGAKTGTVKGGRKCGVKLPVISIGSNDPSSSLATTSANGAWLSEQPCAKQCAGDNNASLLAWPGRWLAGCTAAKAAECCPSVVFFLFPLGLAQSRHLESCHSQGNA